MTRSSVSGDPALEFAVSELQRCKLPKTCYQTCELNTGPDAGSYRRSANFGGGENVQSAGMGAFTGTHPLYPSQPWLGNAQGGIVASAGAGHFFDRSGGGAARERMSHEGYLYIPAVHVAEADEIRFLALGQQFNQVRISPAGGDLDAATIVGQVNYLNAPINRQVGAPVSVNQDEVYGVLSYVLDRQDNADVRIQYRFNGGAWADVPLNWLYPNLADAQAASSDEILWCVQGEIGTNETDDRRLTENEISVLGVSSELVDCPGAPGDVASETITIENGFVAKLSAQPGQNMNASGLVQMAPAPVVEAGWTADGTSATYAGDPKMVRVSINAAQRIADAANIQRPAPQLILRRNGIEIARSSTGYIRDFSDHEESSNSISLIDYQPGPDATYTLERVQESSNAGVVAVLSSNFDFEAVETREITVQTVVAAPATFAPLYPAANGKVVSDNFQDGNGNSPFNLQVRNTTNAAVDWQVCIPAAPYATIPALNLPAGVNHDITDNGDGTFRHCFDGAGLGAFANVTITGGLPVPAGVGGTGNLELYCE